MKAVSGSSSNKNCFGFKIENKWKKNPTNPHFTLLYYLLIYLFCCCCHPLPRLLVFCVFLFFPLSSASYLEINNENPRSSCFHLYCASRNWPCQLRTFWKRACDWARRSIWYLSAESEKNLFCYWTAGKRLLRNQNALSTRSLFRASGQLTCRAFLF